MTRLGDRPADSPWLTLDEAAAYARMGRDELGDLLRSGELKAVLAGILSLGGVVARGRSTGARHLLSSTTPAVVLRGTLAVRADLASLGHQVKRGGRWRIRREAVDAYLSGDEFTTVIPAVARRRA